jgi:hypothetical protein
MTTSYELNISKEEDGKSENFYYQKFYDFHDWHKVREVIRIVNEFEPRKPINFCAPQLTIDYLNDMTDDARNLADQTGASLNWELLKILNSWILENT